MCCTGAPRAAICCVDASRGRICISKQAYISRARMCPLTEVSERCNACQLPGANGGLTQSAPSRPRVRLSPKHNTSQEAECTMLLKAYPLPGRHCACNCAPDRRVVTFCTA